MSSTSFSIEVCLLSRSTFLTSFSSVDPSLHLFINGTDLVTHSSQAIMFHLLKDPVLWEMSCLCICCMSCTCRTSYPHYRHRPRRGPLGMMFQSRKADATSLFSGQSFCVFCKHTFSIRHSSLANPKRLEFEELSLGNAVPLIFRQKAIVSFRALFRNICPFFQISPDFPFTVDTSS